MGSKSFTASYSHFKPDGVYNSLVVAKFIKCLMYAGKKATAQRVFYGAMEIIGKRMKDQNSAGRIRTYNPPVNSRLLYH